MAIVSIRELIEAGVHFGHRVSRWNPKMKPYIFGKRNLIHIIDLTETVKGLIKGTYFLRKVAARGEEIVFVGTKRQARSTVEAEAKRCEMHYVTERWLGGTLTNFRTILARVKRLEELEKMEEDGSLHSYSKKMISSLMREKRKIKRNLEGIRRMRKLPGALFVVDPRREKNAVAEAAKLGIPVVALLDTDSDPESCDIAIPGNDDAMRSVQLVVTRIADAVFAGKKTHVARTPSVRPEAARTESKKPPGGRAAASRGKPAASGRGRTATARPRKAVGARTERKSSPGKPAAKTAPAHRQPRPEKAGPEKAEKTATPAAAPAPTKPQQESASPGQSPTPGPGPTKPSDETSAGKQDKTTTE